MFLSNSELEALRLTPATKAQKSKIRWFGVEIDEGITRGEAHDLLEELVKKFPQKKLDYDNRPATKEQIKKLIKLGMRADDVEDSYSYGEARALIQTKTREYELSDDCAITEMAACLNASGVNPRKIKVEEVREAWNLVKSRKSDKLYSPSDYAIVGALAELFPDLKSLSDRY